MAKDHRPRKGSRAYWPRKKARRIYPVAMPVPKRTKDKVEPMAFAGYKAGMTQVMFTDSRKTSTTAGQEINEAVTVLDCPPLVVCGMKLYRKGARGLESEATVWHDSLPKDLTRKLDVPKKPHMKQEIAGKDLDRLCGVRLIVCTQPRGTGIGKKRPEVFEVPVSGDVAKQFAYALEKLGKEISQSEVFAEGEVVDVKAVSKGKGYQGVVKRFGVKIRNTKSGGKMRHIGSMGAVKPSRVLPGDIAQAGQHGYQTRTEYNKRILKMSDSGLMPEGGFLRYGKVPKHFMLVHGSVPGSKKRLIILRKAMRPPPKPAPPIEIKHVALDSQQ